MIAATTTMATRYDDSELATITDYITRATPMLREETLRLPRRRDRRTTPSTRWRSRASARATPRSASSNGATRLTVVAEPGPRAALHAPGSEVVGRRRARTATTSSCSTGVRRSPTSAPAATSRSTRTGVGASTSAAGSRTAPSTSQNTIVDDVSVKGGISSVDLQPARARRARRRSRSAAACTP